MLQAWNLSFTGHRFQFIVRKFRLCAIARSEGYRPILTLRMRLPVDEEEPALRVSNLLAQAVG
jgi:hypothetical protein